MSRKRTPWTLRKRSGSKNWYVRFHFRGDPVERTTGTKLESEANKIAAVIYTDVVTGRTRTGTPSAKDASTTVEDLGVLWLNSISNTVVPDTLKGYGIHLRHIQDYFGVIANLSSAESENYVNLRLGKVQRPTVMKEKATLQALVNWAQRHGHLAETFRVPPIKKNVVGTKFEKRRRGNATPLSAEEADKIVDRLPEWSMTRTEEPFPVRSRIKFMRETGFRPSMVDSLSMPEHYRPGEKTVCLERRTNKGRVDRDIPLTRAAVEALETARSGRDAGLIFGQHGCRLVLKAAAIGVVDETRRARLTQEDFRHKRLTEFAETGNPVGASYLAGHTNTETIKHYAKPERQAADKVLAAIDPKAVEDAEEALEELESQRASEAQEALDAIAELDAIEAFNQKNLGSDLGSRLSAQVEQPAEPVAPKEKPPGLPGVTYRAQGRTRTGTPLLALAPESNGTPPAFRYLRTLRTHRDAPERTRTHRILGTAQHRFARRAAPRGSQHPIGGGRSASHRARDGGAVRTS